MSKFLNRDYNQEFPALGTELDSIKTRERVSLTRPQVAQKIMEIINSANTELIKKTPNKQIIVNYDKALAQLISENNHLITTKQINDVIHLFAHKQHHITLDLTKVLNNAITDRLDSFDLNKLMLYYVNMQISPNEEIYTKWVNEFTTSTKATNIETTIWLHEKLSISPNESVMSKWIQKATNALTRMDSKEVLGSLWALSSLQTIDKIDADIDLTAIKTSLINALDIPNILRSKADIKHKLLTTDYMNKGCILTAEQRQSIIDQQRTTIPTHSQLQTKAFKKLFSTPEEKATLTEEAWIEELAIYVDGYISSKKLIIQIDGNTHYTNDFTGEPCITFQTQLNTKLLESLGYKVIRISSYEIAKKGWEISYKEQIEAEPNIILDSDSVTQELTDRETSDTASYNGDVDGTLLILPSDEDIEINLAGDNCFSTSLDLITDDTL